MPYAFFDTGPVAVGQALVTTRREVEDWFVATDAEQHALMGLVKECKRLLDQRVTPTPYVGQ